MFGPHQHALEFYIHDKGIEIRHRTLSLYLFANRLYKTFYDEFVVVDCKDLCNTLKCRSVKLGAVLIEIFAFNDRGFFMKLTYRNSR